ncbi:MAG: cytochrome c [Magnetococcus sp. MYC-9]
MSSNPHYSRRLIDKYFSGTDNYAEFLSMTSPQQNELRWLCKLYKNTADQYMTNQHFENKLKAILQFLIFEYKMGKQIQSITKDDVFGYFQWQLKKGIKNEDVSANMVCLTDFFLVMLQEGVIIHNPLLKVYELFSRRDFRMVERHTEPKPEGNNTPLPGMPDRPPVAYATPSDPPLSHKEALPRTENRPSRSKKTVPDLSQDVALADPDTGNTPSTYAAQHTKDRSFPTLLMAVVLVFLVYIYFNFSDSLLWHATQEVSDGIPNNSEPRKTEKAKNRKIEFFYKNNMKEYYCRDYLKANCNSSTLRVNAEIPNQENMIAGRMVYVNNCLRCHGDDGRGDGPDALTLPSPLEPLGWAGNGLLERDLYLFWIIAEGGHAYSGSMPQFRNILGRDEIWKVINYVKTLR